MTELRKTILTDLTNDAAVTADNRLLVKPGEYDPYGDYPVVVRSDHHHIHEGNTFMFGEGYQLAAAASQRYLVTVADDTKRVHMLLHVLFALAGTVRVYEGADRTGTTLQTVFNRDRDSATAELTTIHKGTSGGTTDGTLIWGMDIGSAGAGAGGGGTRGESEIILKNNTKYVVIVTSQAANNNISVEFDWYEQAPA